MVRGAELTGEFDQPQQPHEGLLPTDSQDFTSWSELHFREPLAPGPNITLFAGYAALLTEPWLRRHEGYREHSLPVQLSLTEVLEKARQQARTDPPPVDCPYYGLYKQLTEWDTEVAVRDIRQEGHHDRVFQKDTLGEAIELRRKLLGLEPGLRPDASTTQPEPTEEDIEAILYFNRPLIAIAREITRSHNDDYSGIHPVLLDNFNTLFRLRDWGRRARVLHMVSKRITRTTVATPIIQTDC